MMKEKSRKIKSNILDLVPLNLHNELAFDSISAETLWCFSLSLLFVVVAVVAIRTN